MSDLHPTLAHHIVNTLGWPSLRPLQKQALAPLMAGKDAVLLASTSGGRGPLSRRPGNGRRPGAIP